MRLRLFCTVLWLPLLTLSVLSQQAAQSSTAKSDLEKYRESRIPVFMNDFGELARYRDANAALKPPSADENRIIFFGDSITDGWKLDQYFPGKPYINRGISGQTTPQMLVRFRPDVIALQPKVVVILAGTNDLAGNTGPITVESIEDNLRSMAELAILHGIRVVFASVLPINDYTKNKDGAVIQSARRPPDKIIAINQWMKKYAEQNNQTYLDYFSSVVDDKGFLKEDLSRDGLHPNAKGYEVMKPLAQQAIESALQRKSK